MKISIKSAHSVDIFLSPGSQFERPGDAEAISQSNITEEEEFAKISLPPGVLSAVDMTNLIISWNFKHIVVREEGRGAPMLVHQLQHLVKINFFAVNLR